MWRSPKPESDRCGRTTPLDILFVLAALATALGLRLLGLSAAAPTGDEAMHLHPMSFADAFVFDLANNPPIFRLLTQAACSWQRTMGTARLVSAIAGALTVVPLYIGVRRCAGPVPAVLAAVLLAVHPWHIRYSQTARAYALLTLLSTTGFAFGRVADDCGRILPRVLQGICHMAGLFTHYLAIIPIFTEGFLAARSKGRKNAALLLAGPLLATLVLGPAVWQGWQGKMAAGSTTQFVSGLPFLMETVKALLCPGGLALVCMLAFFLAGAFRPTARAWQLQAISILGLTLMASLFIPVEVRYTLTAVPYSMAALAVGGHSLFLRCPGRTARQTMVVAAILSATAIVFPLPIYYNDAARHDEYRELARRSNGMEELLGLTSASKEPTRVIIGFGGPEHFRATLALHGGSYPDGARLADHQHFSTVSSGPYTVTSAGTVSNALELASLPATPDHGVVYLLLPVEQEPHVMTNFQLVARYRKLALWQGRTPSSTVPGEPR